MSGKSEQKIIIAGLNDAGKTTFAREFLTQEAHCPTFINGGLIAAGLAPFRQDQAAFRVGQLMMEEIHNHRRNCQSFAFETTLSGRNYARLRTIRLWIPTRTRNNAISIWRGQRSPCNAPSPKRVKMPGETAPGFLSGRMAALSKSGRKRHLASDYKSFNALAYAAK